MANRIALTLVFTCSFLTYLTPELTDSLQLVPLILFAVLVFYKVFRPGSLLGAAESLLEPDGLLFILLLALLTLGPSWQSHFDKSLGYWLVFTVCLVLARLYMAVVPIREVVEAFFWSGILSIAIFVLASFAGFVRSVQTLERFSAFTFQPNLLAFLLAGYFCVMVWKFTTGGWWMKILAGLAGLVCLVIIFFASSRGSIVAIIFGLSLVAVMVFASARRERRIRLLRRGLLAAALLLGLVLSTQNLEWTQDAFAFVDNVLALSNGYRGMGTGFSGRLSQWKETMRIFHDGTFLLGHGMRSSDLAGKTVDNSYLVILYEAGAFPLLLIVWRFLDVLRRFLAGYAHAPELARKRLCLVGSLLMAVFLVNNVVERMLFAVGNPYSLLALLLFAAPATRVEPQVSLYVQRSRFPRAPMARHPSKIGLSH